jgi:NAD(P)-dependent dehydrogenase (short-subunit alcohol dehydrogenase family)
MLTLHRWPTTAAGVWRIVELAAGGVGLTSMASSASGKIAFVTGGASGIGAALATKLVGKRAEVWIADRQVGPAEELAQRLNSVGGKAHAIELDVRDYPSFKRTVDEAVQQSGRIDYLFNNAGIGVGGEIDSYTLDDWNDVFDVDLRGVVHGIQAVYPIMIRQRSGHIVNTASMAGLVTTGGQASYSATKHAVVAISKTLRLEAERHGLQVSVLCPGVIRTPILAGGQYGRVNLAGVSDGDALKFWEAVRPMAPDMFAERALRAVLRGDTIIVVPAWWKAWWYLERLSPALSMRAAKVALKRMREMQDTAS